MKHCQMKIREKYMIKLVWQAMNKIKQVVRIHLQHIVVFLDKVQEEVEHKILNLMNQYLVILHHSSIWVVRVKDKWKELISMCKWIYHFLIQLMVHNKLLHLIKLVYVQLVMELNVNQVQHQVDVQIVVVEDQSIIVKVQWQYKWHVQNVEVQVFQSKIHVFSRINMLGTSCKGVGV